MIGKHLLLVFIVIFIGCGANSFIHPGYKTAMKHKLTPKPDTQIHLTYIKNQHIKIKGGEIKLQDNKTKGKALSSSPPKRKFQFDFIAVALCKALSNLIQDPDILRIVSKVISSVIWSYLVLSILGTFGIDTKPLLSLFGVGSLTIGFTIKDFLSDICAGLILLFIRPFQRGDIITIGNLKGRVLSIDTRYVKLFDEKEMVEILLPVAVVYKSDIKIQRKTIPHV